MEYSPDEWNWIEVEWAYHCHGRTAFISPEDFRQAKAWGDDGVPAEALVAAMGSYFDRRAKRPRPRAYVAMAHIKKDVEKLMALRRALARAGTAIPTELPAWGSVREPLKSDPKARVAFEAWMHIKCKAPEPESPGYLEHLDAERQAQKEFVIIAAAALSPHLEALQADLANRLALVDIEPGSIVWKRAWEHHFSKDVCAAWGLGGV